MTGDVFCPSCQSIQPPEVIQAGAQPRRMCARCGTPLDGPRDVLGAEPSMPPTVLCIDDDRIVLSWLADNLERTGFRTLLASDGPTGVQIAKRERPDAILLDVLLPGESGFDVCRQLRNDSKVKDTPIILLTAMTDPSVSTYGHDVGATITLRKPFGPATIIKTLEQVLGRPTDPSPL